MNISKNRVIFIILVIAYAFIIINLSVSIYRLCGLFYSLLITIAIITIPLIIVLIKKKLNTYPWYKEMTDKQYHIFHTAYNSYQNDVLIRGKSYSVFVNEYHNSHLFISRFTDSNGNLHVNELNRKNLHISRVLNLLQNRKDLVDKYFQKDNFDYSCYLALIRDYNDTMLPFADDINIRIYNIENKFVEGKMKEFVLSCYENDGIKSLGDRNFGYYIRHRHPEFSTTKQYIDAWNKYIGKYEPRDGCKYINDPSYWKNKAEIPATLKSIERIELFYLSLMQEGSSIVNTIRRDKIKLEKAKN